MTTKNKQLMIDWLRKLLMGNNKPDLDVMLKKILRTDERLRSPLSITHIGTIKNDLELYQQLLRAFNNGTLTEALKTQVFDVRHDIIDFYFVQTVNSTFFVSVYNPVELFANGHLLDVIQIEEKPLENTRIEYKSKANSQKDELRNTELS